MTDLRATVALALNGVGLGCDEFSPEDVDSGCPDCGDLLRYTDAVVSALDRLTAPMLGAVPNALPPSAATHALDGDKWPR